MATALPVYSAHDKSTLQRFGRQAGKAFGYSGFQCLVSKRQWDDLPGQVSDAIRFLRRHEGELKRLRDEFGVRDLRLDFPYFLRIGRKNICVQSDFLPSALVSQAGKLGVGIVLTLYTSRPSARQWEKITEYAAGRITPACRKG